MARFELVIDHLRNLLYRDACAPTDTELLQQFATRHDATAFAALVHRYGSLVMGVCRRVLPDDNDCEDVFQATFVVLVRKAGSINASLPSWLHQVAFHLALKAKARLKQRRQRERQVDPMPEPEKTSQAASAEMYSLLDEELERLPVKYRSPMTLCYLAGKTSDEAAQELGCSKDTIRGRLARGRELLRSRLGKRGVALSSGVLTAVLAENAAVSAACVNATISAALAVASKGAAAGVLSASVAALVEGGMRQMFMAKVKMVVCVLLAVIMVGTGAGVMTHKLLGGGQAKEPGDQVAGMGADKDKPAKAERAKQDSKGKTDPPGVPLDLKLVAKKDTYTLDAAVVEKLPLSQLLPLPALKVDLELQVHNRGEKKSLSARRDWFATSSRSIRLLKPLL